MRAAIHHQLTSPRTRPCRLVAARAPPRYVGEVTVDRHRCRWPARPPLLAKGRSKVVVDHSTRRRRHWKIKRSNHTLSLSSRARARSWKLLAQSRREKKKLVSHGEGPTTERRRRGFNSALGRRRSIPTHRSSSSMWCGGLISLDSLESPVATLSNACGQRKIRVLLALGPV
jgi:hypothetical protein